ncbi:MAG: NADH-quinone oxidoreductase subunit NuoN [Pelagibacteraceae bacterium]|jgi:NADH-quinone oxidoreductase subunit N|nr:NADH-quinone oxidoreductase subunit NuoN [Pelagibacteraceae bacterium]
MENINFFLPEIFLTISILSTLMIGVFFKNSYILVTSIVYGIVIALILIIFNSFNDSFKLFSDSFVSNSFTNFFKILILVGTFFTLIITQNFIKETKINYFEYSLILLLSVLGMFIMISANDLILFYLGLELQSLSLYILASLDRDNLKSNESGLKYFILSSLASGLLLYGCSILYGFSGSTNFEIIKLNTNTENIGTVFAMVFILVGLAFKVSAVPFHMWTPDVYEGSPSSVTSFFAVVPKIAGIAVFIRFMQIPFNDIADQWQPILIFISLSSMILGAVAAIGQSNIKRLIAYSSIGHIGFALAGISTNTTLGYSSSITYITIYVIMNLGMFACIFSMKREGKYCEKLDDLSGISEHHPILSIALLIILFSLAGIPPLAGFFAKFYIFVAVIENEMYTLAIIGLLSTVISAFYYLRVIKIIYFNDVSKSLDKIKNLGISTTLFLSSLILITFFIYPSFLNTIVETLIIN